MYVRACVMWCLYVCGIKYVSVRCVWYGVCTYVWYVVSTPVLCGMVYVPVCVMCVHGYYMCGVRTCVVRCVYECCVIHVRVRNTCTRAMCVVYVHVYVVCTSTVCDTRTCV